MAHFFVISDIDIHDLAKFSYFLSYVHNYLFQLLIWNLAIS